MPKGRTIFPSVQSVPHRASMLLTKKLAYLKYPNSRRLAATPQNSQGRPERPERITRPMRPPSQKLNSSEASVSQSLAGLGPTQRDNRQNPTRVGGKKTNKNM